MLHFSLCQRIGKSSQYCYKSNIYYKNNITYTFKVYEILCTKKKKIKSSIKK